MRTKKTLRNLAFNFFQQLVGIATNFIIPPLIVANFGSTLNGLISTIKQMMTYAQLTGAGISQSSTYALYEPMAKKDYTSISGIYNATNKMFIHAGNIFTLIVLILAVVYPICVSNVDYPIVFFLVLIIGVSGISEFYVYGKYQTIVNANQNNYIIAFTQAIGNIANVLVSVLLVKMKASVVVVQIGASIVYIMRIFILRLYVKSRFPYLDKKVQPMLEKINQRNDAIVHQIAGLIVFSSSTIIISITCGLKQSSVYTVYALVFNGIDTICAMISTAIYASFGEIIAQQEDDLLKKTFNLFESLYFFVAFVVYSVAFLMIMPFISIYTRNMTDENYYLPLLGGLFVLVGIANNIRVPARTLVNAAGHFKETRNRAIIEMSISLLGQIIFSMFFGIYGVLLGCLLSYAYRTIDFVFYTNKKIIKTSSYVSLKKIIINIITSVVFVFFFKSCIHISVDNYLSWFIWAFVTTMLAGVFFTIIYLVYDRKNLLQTINIVKRMFIKRGRSI